jgi:putative ABC transport system permease protein
MFKNYLKIALRNLRRHKIHSIITIGGLAVSMSLCLLIILFIKEQLTYDRFHKHANRIYRVTMKIKTADGDKSYATSPASISPILLADYPGVEGVVTLKQLTSFASKAGENEKAVKIKGFHATSSFFEVFSFGLAAGNPETALSEPNRIVLSQETAIKLFGDEKPLGKVLSLEQAGSFVITGVLKPMPARTSLKFDVLLSSSTLLSSGEDDARNWRNSAFSSYNYLLLKKNELPAGLEARLSRIIPLHYAPESSDDVQITAFDLQPLLKIRLGRELANQHEFTLPTVIVMAVGMLVLIVTAAACFNYINLTTARSLKRAKEIGVRKVVGARRLQLTWQFMSEAMLIAFTACVLAFPMLHLLIPAFNSLWAVQWTGSQISP